MKQHNKINGKMIAISFFSVGIMLQSVYAAETYSPFYQEESSNQSTSQTKKSQGASSVLEIEDAAVTEEKHPFTGSEEQIDELKKLEPINNNLTIAVDAHNLINRLRDFKNIQKQYNNTEKLHNRSVELLQDSEQCTIDYMGRYFQDPVKVWSGKDMRSTPQNHDLRQGLSAWAISLFETAKAAQVSPIDVSDVVSVDYTTSESKDSSGNVLKVDSDVTSTTSTVGININNESSTNIETLNANSQADVDALEKQTGGVYFKEPSRQEELEAENRKANLLSKDIGSEVAVWMADYLAGSGTSSGPSWSSSNLGGAKKRFPVWTDQKTFYGQYLIRKYRNIKKYIQNYKVPEEVRQRIADKVFERQEEYMNEAEKQITEAAVNARITARGVYDGEINAAEQKYNDSTNSIESERSSAIAKLDKEKQEKVSEYDQLIAALNLQRDQYMTQISNMNAAINNMTQELNNLQQEINSYDTLLSGADLTEEQKTEYNNLKSQVQTEISSIEAQITDQRTERDTLQNKYNDVTNTIIQTQKEKSDFESDIQVQKGQTNSNATANQEQALDTYNQDLDKAEKTYKDKLAKIDAAEVAAKASIGSNSMITAKQIIAQTDLIIENAKQIAYDNIEKTLAAMRALGDELYRGNIQPTLLSYHQALMETLKGNEASVAGVALEAADGRVHDLTNYNIDIVISNYMDEQMREMYLNNYRNSVENTTIILRIPLFDKMLEGVNTGTDSQYFIGAQPKTEDFTAPKAMPDYNLPPLREFVRLDYVDLENIGMDTPKMEAGYYRYYTEKVFGKEITRKEWVQTESIYLNLVDKEKLLSYGGKIPEVWQLMLKDKAFVDSDFYLTADMDPDGSTLKEFNPLQQGAEMSSLYRGGIYPCVLTNIRNNDELCTVDGTIEGGKAIIDVSVIDKEGTNPQEYFMGLSFVTGERRASLLSRDLPICQEVSAKCKTSVGKTEHGFGKISKPYLTLLNKDDETGNISESFVPEGASSELGSIVNIYSGRMVSDLSPVTNVMTYSPYMQSVVNYGQRMEEKAEQENGTDMSAAEKQNDDIYVRAQYNNNQVGDFLEHVELEQDYQQALDELEEQVKETKDELYESLRSFGFEPSADFDIANEEDYDLAVKQLKQTKEKYMSQAKSGIDSIVPGGSDVLADSQASYRRVYQGLLLDSEAVVQMSMDVENLSDFSEQIKTATTNLTVDDTYEKNGDEDFEEAMKSLAPAYCAAY